MAKEENSDLTPEGFEYKGIMITDPSMDETARFEVVPELHYGEPYSDWMILKYEKELNKLLRATSHTVSIIETSEYYGDGDDEVDESDPYYDKVMFEAYIEDEDGEQVGETTGRYCSISDVCDELWCSALEHVEFDKIYDYDESIISAIFDNDSQLGMLETFGEDLQQLQKIEKDTPKRVWTVYDAEDGIRITAGRDVDNHIYYVITTKEWENENEDFLIKKDEQ